MISLVSELTPLLSSALLFFLLIGLLPTIQYGIFVAITASALIINPVARAGANIVLLRDLGAQRRDQDSWNDAISTTVTTTFAAVGAWAIVGPWIIPETAAVASILIFWQQLVPRAISDLVTTFLFGKAEMAATLRARVVFAGWRIFGLLLYWLLDTDGLSMLGGILLATGLLGACQNVWLLHRRFGIGTSLRIANVSRIRRGLPDSVSQATGSVLDSIDRPMLTRAGFIEDTARYGVAMRLVSLAGISTVAMLRPFDRETFRAGTESVAKTASVMLRAAKRTFPTSLVAASGLWAVSGLLPDLLPSDYAEATDIIRWGVWMIPLRALSFPFGNVLTAAGHRMSRLGITALAAIGNITGNLILMPRFSWRAAVGTTLVSEAFMAVAAISLCWYYVRSERRSLGSARN